MSVNNTHRPVVPQQGPTFDELLKRVLAGIFFVPVAGPPVILLLGPWLILVLLLIPPAAFLITLALVFLVGAGLVVALGGLIASPYLLVHHVHARHQLRARQPARRRRCAFVHRPARPAAALHLTTR